MAQDPTRRGVLTSAALAAAGLPLLVSGCRGIGGLGTPPKPLPDVTVATDAIAGERALIARYTAVIAAMPGLAGQLRPLLAQHNQHLAGLISRLSAPHAPGEPTPTGGGNPGGASAGAGTDGSAGSGSAGSTGNGATTGAGASAPPVPSTPAAALASLRSAEDAASASLLGHLPVVSPSFAQLLASIAASESTHAQLLHRHGQAR